VTLELERRFDRSAGALAGLEHSTEDVSNIRSPSPTRYGVEAAEVQFCRPAVLLTEAQKEVGLVPLSLDQKWSTKRSTITAE